MTAVACLVTAQTIAKTSSGLLSHRIPTPFLVLCHLGKIGRRSLQEMIVLIFLDMVNLLVIV